MTIIAGAHRGVSPNLSRLQPTTFPFAADPAYVSSPPVSSVLRLCATRTYPPDLADSDDGQRCGAATFGVRRPSAIRVAVAVMGDIDALNARDFGRYVERHTDTSRQLVLDLRAVDFFGSDGFTALYYISVHCARSDLDWSIVASPAVRRLLSICDPDGKLPLAEDLPSALGRLDRVAQCCHRVVHK
jgi:anti-anti-sigma factor